MGVPGSADLMVLATAAQAGGTAYQVEQSLSSNGTPYLQFTPSSDGDRRKFTWSFWTKIGSNTYAPNMYAGGPGYLSHTISMGSDAGAYINDLVWQGGGEIWSVWNDDALVRDDTAWYHICYQFDSTQSTTANRRRWYRNGVLIPQSIRPAGGYSDCPQNYYTGVNRNGTPFKVLTGDGYMSQVMNFDGQNYGPENFGEFDDNGVWRPIEINPSNFTWGTNGFFLTFDSSASNGVGHDHSGNGNHFSTQGGSGFVVVNDSPTNNQGKMQRSYPFGVSQAYARYFANAGLTYHSGRNSPALAYPNILLPKSGKYYVEYTITAGGSGGSFYAGNLFVISDPRTGDSYGTSVTSYEGGYGATTYNGSAGSSGAIWRSGPYNVAIAIDMDTGDVEYFLNGTSQSSGTISAANLALDLCIAVSGATGSSTTVTYDINFGTKDFVYTPPSGYGPLSTATFPEPGIKKPTDHFNAVIYDGSNSSKSIDVGFQPDMVWIKCRSDLRDHKIVDVIRGTTKYLVPNETYTESTHTDFVTNFTSSGFTLAGNAADTNQSGKTYVAWCWKAGGSGESNDAGSITSTVSANPQAGFSIVTYAGNSTSNATVGHGLGQPPALIIVKNRTNSNWWKVYHKERGIGYYVNLNDSYAFSNSNVSNVWGSSAPTDTVFSLGSGSDGSTNASSNNYVAYCFAEIPGFSKIGKYIGNGSSDGPMEYTGFRPAFLMVRKDASSVDWKMYDNKRNIYNPVDTRLEASTNRADLSGNGQDLDFYANGFKLRGTNGDQNSSGTFYYIAFAEFPFGGEGVSPGTAR